MIVVTYHPVTLEKNSLRQVEILLNVLKKKTNIYLFTKANADASGEEN